MSLLRITPEATWTSNKQWRGPWEGQLSLATTRPLYLHVTKDSPTYTGLERRRRPSREKGKRKGMEAGTIQLGVCGEQKRPGLLLSS